MSNRFWTRVVFAFVISSGFSALALSQEAPKGGKPQEKASEKASSESKGASSSPRDGSSYVNINTATAVELETLPGVGPALAREIIAGRPYKTVAELDRVKGIGPSKLSQLRGKVTADGSAPPQGVADVDASKGGTKKKKSGVSSLRPGEMINLNTASQSDLEKLPTIGASKAKAIIAGRPYEKIEDVMKVSGIKEGTFTKIKEHISVK